MNEAAAKRSVALWDLPVRLVHWSFVALMPALWWTAENGELGLHRTLGLVMFGLVVFRLLWGFLGSSTARFSGFVRGPAAIRAYLAASRSGTAPPTVGHNPLGALSVIALIGLLGLQVGLGLIAIDTDAVASGPLSRFVSYETGERAAEIHELVFNVIVAFIVLHIAAILYYRFIKRDNLVSPMVTGRKDLPANVPAPRIAPLWLATLLAILTAILTVWIAWELPPWKSRWPWDQPPAAAGLSEESYM